MIWWQYAVKLPLWNISEASLCLFAMFAVKFVAAGSLWNYLYAIRSTYLSIGLHNPLRPGLLLRRVVKELMIKERGFVRYRMSLSVPVLRAIYTGVSIVGHDQRCLKAALCLGVFLLLRIGELASSNLLRSDYRFRDGTGALLLRFSKSDQLGKGFVLLCFSLGVDVCPYAAMCSYISKSVVHLEPSGPLFVFANGSRLTRSKLISFTMRLLSAASYQVADFSGISLRKGGAFSLSSVGVNDRVIRALGRWKGWCYDRYIEITAKHVRKAHLSMLKCKRSDRMTAKEVWKLLK
jgi:hypothetical protein